MSNYKIRRRLTSALLVLCMSAVTPVTVLADPTDDILLDTVDETDIGMEYQDDSYDEMIISEPADEIAMDQGSGDVFADGDGVEPAPIQNFEKNGVHYYKVDTNEFEKSTENQSEINFYRDLLTNKNMDYKLSRKSWVKIAGGVLRYKHNYSGDGLGIKIINYMGGRKDSWDETPPSTTDLCTTIPFQEKGSLKDMELDLLQRFPYSDRVIANSGLFQDENGAKSGPVFYQGAYGHENDRKAHIAMAVVFSDFKVSPIIPDAATEGNYITHTVSDVTKENIAETTTLKNDSNTNTNGSQTVEKTAHVEVASEISGSKEYTWSESVTMGMEYGFSEILKATMQVGFSASEAVQKGWSKRESVQDENKSSHTISATLPPYTGAILKQLQGKQVIETKYNCPVALSYTVRVLHYRAGYNSVTDWSNGGYRENNYLDSQSYVDATFGQSFAGNAQKDLYKRFQVDGNNNVDPDHLNWQVIKGDGLYEIVWDALDFASEYVPMASTPATFTETINTTDTELRGVAPLHPLKYVQLKDEKKKLINLKPGDIIRVDEIEIEGLAEENNIKGPYYGFDKAYGKWILTDEEGRELTDGSIARFTKNARTGALSLEASAPGTVYLEYLIDEDKYSTFSDGNTFATNTSLSMHPVIEVEIKGNSVTGVTLNPSKLTLKEGETGDLTATVTPDDATDKTVTWTAADPKVATVNNGKVTGVAAGKTKVTVKTTDGSKTADADITVKYATPAAVQVDENLTGLVAGGEYQINGTKYTANDKGLIPVDKAWHDKEITIVRVNSDSDLNSPEQKLKVVEKTVVVEGVNLDPVKLTISEGQTGSFTVVITPEEATNKDVTWTIADPKVATVADGTVTGIAAGKTRVTVTTLDGEKTTDADVTVKYATPSAKQTKEYLTGFVANAEYQINGTTYTADEEGTIAVVKEWYDKEITIIRVNADADLNSDEQKLNVKNPSKQDPTPKPTPSNLISLKSVKINGFKNSLPYTGEAVKQNATLTYGSGKTKVTLVEDKDYTVTYKNNYDLGTATVIYEATDDEGAQFTDSVEKTFSITGRYTLITDGKDENCTITLASDEYAYANGPIKPEVTVTAMLVNNNGEIEERVLTPGKDYALSYKNNKNVAAADAVNSKNGKDIAPQVVIKGKGKYEFADTEDMKKGAVKRFAITQCDISELVLTVNDVVYNKKANKYKNTKIQFFDKDYKDLKLKVNKDYTVEYETSDDSDAPKAGQTVTVTITAAMDKDGNYSGNYEGTATATYRVVDNKANINISKAKVIVNPDANDKAQTCTYTGEAIEPGQDGQPALKVVIGSGKNAKTLTLGEEFEIVGYYNNIKAGNNAVLLVKGKDTYYGTKAVKFKIK